MTTCSGGFVSQKKYVVRLDEKERDELQALVDRGRVAGYKLKNANVLLRADVDGPAMTDPEISDAVGVHLMTVRNVRERFVERGLQGALERKKQDRPSRERMLDGKGEARLLAIACGSPPAGRARWTMHLLADRLVELKIVDSISYRTVGRTLKKMNSSPTSESAGLFHRRPTRSS